MAPAPAITPPRLNVNNRNQDDWAVGQALLAKKIQAAGNFAPVIQAMKEKGRPVLKNVAREDNYLSWHQ